MQKSYRHLDVFGNKHFESIRALYPELKHFDDLNTYLHANQKLEQCHDVRLKHFKMIIKFDENCCNSSNETFSIEFILFSMKVDINPLIHHYFC